MVVLIPRCSVAGNNGLTVAPARAIFSLILSFEETRPGLSEDLFSVVRDNIEQAALNYFRTNHISSEQSWLTPNTIIGG